MPKGFWNKLDKPFFALAPMADVTDPAFRRIIAKYGKPDVMWTEFVSADGLFLGGKDALIGDLKFAKSERPIVAQFFTSKPEMMEKAAKLAVKLGFDGVDINMGCPDRSIEKQGAGAALMKNTALAVELIQAAKKGAFNLPVSVKTRVGYNKDELDTWLPVLLSTEPSAITIHARTRKQMSKEPADWNYVKRAVEMRDRLQKTSADGHYPTLIIGNGDIVGAEDAKEKARETGADGVMFGRAIFGNPWLFNENRKEVAPEEKLKVLAEHIKLFGKITPYKNFSIMKKHFKAYVNGWAGRAGKIGAKQLRAKLMETETPAEAEKIINEYLRK